MSEADHARIPVTAETRMFWDGCTRKELLYQYCLDCGRPQFYPRATCVQCRNAEKLEWRKSTCKGTVHSFTTVHRAPSPAFKAEIPYVVALIDLDEGFRMMMNVLPAQENIAIGQRVRISFQQRENMDTVPFAEIAN